MGETWERKKRCKEKAGRKPVRWEMQNGFVGKNGDEKIMKEVSLECRKLVYYAEPLGR